jgi:queuine/archaeosine tRNA-ribosyltransferase
MSEMRQAVRENRFEDYRKDFYRRRESVAQEPLDQDAVN